MRQFFFLFVLVAYIAAAPTGRPAVDFFDSNAIAIARCTAKLQADWQHRQYAALLDVCPDDRRAEATRGLLFAIEEGWADEGAHPPQLSEAQTAQVREFEGRVAALEKTAGSATTTEDFRQVRAAQGVLYADIMTWARANHRIDPTLEHIFTNEPRIVRFDRTRADVQFCAADRSKSASDPKVTFFKSGGRWTWPLADRLTLLLGEARRLELSARAVEPSKRADQLKLAKDVLLTATAEEQKEPRVDRLLKRINEQLR